MAQTILAVDDDVDILDLLEISLDSDGYDVITAGDGLDAIAKAKSHVPDLIVLDLMMPKMDGFEVIDNLRLDSQTRAIPVIMLTARAQITEKLQGLDAGADDYITKPFDLKELSARIKAVLGRTQPTKYINPLIGAMGDWFSETGVEQLATHLKTAATIQQRLLPQVPPDIPGFDINGVLRSSTSVSGDFYDFILLDDGCLGMVIADVRGKGIPAALLMVMIRTALRLVCRQESSPAAVIKSINDLLVIDTEPDLFATMVYGILDPNAMTFTYSNAGHCHPLHLKDTENLKKRGTGIRGKKLTIHQLRTGGMVAGSFDFAEFENETVELHTGDTIFFYTDGITEAEREKDGAFYGEERLLDVIRSSKNLSAEMICKTIEENLVDFIGRKQQTDDLTLVVLKATADGAEGH